MQRRNFLMNSLKAGLGMVYLAGTPMEVLAGYRKAVAANDKIGVGLIGCKGMGWANLTSMLKIPEVQCVALCDVDENVLQQRLADLAKINLRPDTYLDHQKMLERKDMDVVIIATPDHWHCLQMVDACAAGKDVYVEKPACNYIGEAALMVKAAERYGRMVQVNQWQRSQQHFKDAMAYVQSGKLGTIAQCKTWMFNGHEILRPAPDEAVPTGVHYDRWLGPAPKQAFNKNRFHYNFRWYWNYAGGLMTDWGVHLIDMVLLGMDAVKPRQVMSMGGHIAFPDDARQTPDTQTAIFDYGSFQLSWEHTMGRQYGLYGMGHGIGFVGNKGTLLLNRGGWEVRPEMGPNRTPLLEAVPWQKQTDNGLDLHTANFVDCVKSRQAEKLNCPIQAGAKVAEHCHMGNVALRTGGLVRLRPTEGIAFEEAAANDLIMPTYHNGYKLPKV